MMNTAHRLAIAAHEDLDSYTERVFDLVWRFDFEAPGFTVLEVPPKIDSHTLRSWMIHLKQQLSEINVRRGGLPFTFRSLGRFDQQETTKFHLDGAPEQSMLILGYEPSWIRSRLFLADYTKAAFDLGITPLQFLHDYNPMYKRGEELLASYVTELPQPEEDHSRIVLINNSSSSFEDSRRNSLGVLHKAIIENPDGRERRIVNSMMLTMGGHDASQEQQNEFVTTEDISKKFY